MEEDKRQLKLLLVSSASASKSKSWKEVIITCREGEGFIIGRSVNANFNILDMQISRQHAYFSFNSGCWFVTDKSTNGLTLNSVKLKQNTQKQLSEGDILQFGPSDAFVYEVVLSSGEDGSSSFEPAIKKIKTEQTPGFPANVIAERCVNIKSEKAEYGESSAANDSFTLVNMKTLDAQARRGTAVINWQLNNTQQHFEERMNAEEVSKERILEEKRLLEEKLNEQRLLLQEKFEAERTELEKKLAEGEIQQQLMVSERQDLEKRLEKEKEDLEAGMGVERQQLQHKLEDRERVQQELILQNQKLISRLNEEKEEFEKRLAAERKHLLDLELRMNQEKSVLMDSTKKLLEEKKILEQQLEDEKKNLENQLASEKQNGEERLAEVLRQVEQTEKAQADVEKKLKETEEHMKKELAERELAMKQDLESQIRAREIKVQQQAQEEIMNLNMEKDRIEKFVRDEMADMIDKSTETIKQMNREAEAVQIQLSAANVRKQELESLLAEADKTRQEEKEGAALATRKEVIDNIEGILESELQCSVCSELFVQASTLNCSHSFCKSCITEWQLRKQDCPICRTAITAVYPSLVLDNFITRIVEKLSDEMKERRKEILEDRQARAAERCAARPDQRQEEGMTAQLLQQVIALTRTRNPGRGEQPQHRRPIAPRSQQVHTIRLNIRNQNHQF